jgi:hypothetical protein
MYMKPCPKIKRLLRVKVARDLLLGQPTIKVFGYIHPRREETASCKLTSFFRQIAVLNEKDKSTIEAVSTPLPSGRSPPPPSPTRTE